MGLERLYSISGFVLLALVFVAINALATLLFGGARFDLTEQRLYSLSSGTRAIIDKIEEPVRLQFYFSDKATAGNPPLRNYARQVRELLDEYSSRGGDRLPLRVIDPEPFSEAEERAVQLGVQPVQSRAGAETVYFGLVAVDSLDRHKTIPFFDLSQETALEYQISRLLYTLLNPQKPVVGLLSALDTSVGGVRGSQGRPAPWSILDYIRESFALEELGDSLQALPEVDVLMVVRPASMSDDTLYLIEQYVLKGGRALIFVDPWPESLRGGNPLIARESPVIKMLAAWGLTIDPIGLAGDPTLALQVNIGGATQRHPAYMGLKSEVISRDDIITAQLDSINLSTAGQLRLDEDAENPQSEVLLSTTDEGGGIELTWLQSQRDAARLRQLMRTSGIRGRLPLAVRVSGEAKASFAAAPSTRDYTFEEVREASGVNLIVVGDTDMLTDPYWVRAQRFLGRVFTSETADNGSFVQNALENLSGGEDLISVRSRGRFSRPFTVVEAIRREADENYRERSDRLEKRLRETEQELRKLQKEAREQADKVQLRREKRRAVAKFKRERTRIRKQLREVRHQLNRDIDGLNMRLRMINIIAAPLLLTLFLFAVYALTARMMRSRRALS